MNRQRNLIGATLVLAVCAVIYWIWSNWGLVTVDVDGKPLAEVIRSIEKQGHIVMKTNMDAAKPVSMHVYKVRVAEALDVLAGVTEARCRLGYFFAPDAATLKGALETIGSGKMPEGWKSFDAPLFGGAVGGVEDPRRDRWNVLEPAEKTLQAFLLGAATGVSASFTCPEQYNPAVPKAPSSGEIRKLAPQLAKSAGAKLEEVFVLMGRPAGTPEVADEGRDDDFGFRPPGGGPPRGRGGPGGGRVPPQQMRDRTLAEIAKLPVSEQAAAKADFEEKDQMFASLRNLPEEERKAKLKEIMSRPENQDRMAERQIKGLEGKTPEQRLAKYQNYVNKKQQATQSKK